MLDYLQLCIYIDKNKDMIFAAYKENKAGLVVMSEPYEYVDCTEWENVSEHIIKMINEIAKQPITEDTGSNIMKIICKGKGFKQFTKKHICIDAAYKISEKKFIISNAPRQRDGSYGIYKGTLSEKYSTKYSSPCDTVLIQEHFLKAYADAVQYLKETGGEL
ncbi:MAG: hypothetical protein K2N44_15245 [Lachnospiraceae bacterium]|nr:hypothetical protein [Lachnospiraceae bacterium]